MTKEALELALEALETPRPFDSYPPLWRSYKKTINEAITAIKEALAQPEQKYHRGDRLICLETEEYCVIHISGTDRQWVKFPDSHIGVYTNEQVAELFELLPKEPEQEPIKYVNKGETDRLIAQKKETIEGLNRDYDLLFAEHQLLLKKEWVGLTQTQVKLLWEGVQEEAVKSGDSLNWVFYTHINEALKEKNT